MPDLDQDIQTNHSMSLLYLRDLANHESQQGPTVRLPAVNYYTRDSIDRLKDSHDQEVAQTC